MLEKDETFIKVLNGCIKKSEEDWKIFVDTFTPIALSILSKYNNVDEFSKDDIIQNSFIKLLKNGFERFRGNGQGIRYQFLKYFKIIIQNEAISHINSLKKIGNLTTSDDIKGNITIDCVKTNNSIEKNLNFKEIINIVNNILESYEMENKELFWLMIDGFSYKEISEILKIPMGTIASKYSRIKSYLKERLNEKGITLEDF